MTYTLPQMLAACPGLSQEVFKSWVKRDVVRLSVGHPGKGTRPKYSHTDVVQIALVQELAAHDLFLRKAPYIWERIVFPRMVTLAQGDAPGVVVLMYQRDDGGLMHRSIRIDDLSKPNELVAPSFATLFRVDDFIERTTDRMAQVLSEVGQRQTAE